MANKSASVKVSVSYTGPSAESAVVPTVTVAAPYQSQAHGTVDIADTTVADTEYAIPFGAVASATAVLVVNKTGQDLWLKWNAANINSHKQYLPTGGAVMLAFPDVPGSFPTESASVTTTDTQSGAGLVEYHVFGDPT